MQEFENQDEFKPNFTVAFFERFNKFKNELLFWADTRYKTYFDTRNDNIDYQLLSHRLWHYIQPDMSKNGGKPIAVLFLRKGSNLPTEMVDFFDETFSKHFSGQERNPLMRTIFV